MMTVNEELEGIKKEVISAHFRNVVYNSLGCDVAQAVSRWPPTAEACVRARSAWWTKWHWDRIFSVIRFSPVNIILPWLSMLAYYLGDET
jgi:hypothetical protein